MSIWRRSFLGTIRLRLYRQTVPLAIGLIVGNLLNGAVWSVVALLTKGRV